MEATTSPTPEKKVNISIKTDVRKHREFAAACSLLGQTMQDTIHRCMEATIELGFARIRPGQPT